MPVHKCPNGKYRIGNGKCMYDSKEKAEKAYKGYLASKNEIVKTLDSLLIEIKNERQRISEQLDMLWEYDRYLSNLEYVEKYKAGKRGEDLYD